MIRRPPRSTRVRSSAASDVYKRQAVPGGKSVRVSCLIPANSSAMAKVSLRQTHGRTISLRRKCYCDCYGYCMATATATAILYDKEFGDDDDNGDDDGDWEQDDDDDNDDDDDDAF